MKVGNDDGVVADDRGPHPSEVEALISNALLAARRSAVALTGFPHAPPANLETAYGIQERSIPLWPDAIAGWKVGGIPPRWRGQLGADWLVGPIFSRSVKSSRDNQVTVMPVYQNGFAAIEPELIIKLGATRAEDRLFIGAEIASSPVPAINDFGPTAVVCDFGNNNGLLIGDEILNWSQVTGSTEVSIQIDEDQVGCRVLENLADGALTARDFCIEHARSLGRVLQPGTLISTGAITGVHEATVGAKCRISFDRFGQLELQLNAATSLA